MTAARRIAAAGALGLLLLLCASQWASHSAPAGAPLHAADRNSLERVAQPARPRWITGRVRDAAGPVPDAQVRLQASACVVLTDMQGYFRLPAEASPQTVTAASPGYFIATAQSAGEPLEIELLRPADSDASDYAWIDPAPNPANTQNCGNCHAAIFDQWQASAHAAGVANRRLLNLYDGSDWHGRPQRGWSLLGEHSGGAAVCGSCHAPAADLENPQFDDLRNIRGVAAGGVQCDFCHKVRAVATDRVGWEHGRYAMQLLRPSVGQIFFGPLDDASRGEDVYAPLQSDSRYCAACHEGVVFGVPVYSTYSEWLDSAARKQGKQCQSCHMAPDGRMHNIAPGAGGVERNPDTLASHDLLPGGMAVMLRRTLHLTANVTPAVDRTNAGSVEIRLWADDVGHRVPTGYIDRHLILHVEARDAVGRVVDMAGGPRLPPPVGEALAARPGLLLAKLLTDTHGTSPVPFWRAGVTVTDTRLLPGQSAVSRYELPTGAVRFDVRLIYRRFWDAVAREKDWPQDDVVVIERSYPLAAEP